MAYQNRSDGHAWSAGPWFLAGLGVGAVVGALYAPKSGRETREDIAQGAREGTEYLRAKGRDAANKAGEYLDRGQEMVDRGRMQREYGKDVVSDQASRVVAAVETYRSGITEADE